MAGGVVRATAFAIEGTAKDNITAVGAIDTGANKASIAAITDRESHYSAAAAEAQARNPRARVFPEPPQPDEHTALVAVGVEYGIYNEMGTVKMPARPYLQPAVETHREPFEQALAAVVRRAAQG